jgi:hypothetical protein
MNGLHRMLGRTRVLLLLAAPLCLLLLGASARASAVLYPFAADPYSSQIGQHHTEVEPDSFAHGSTLVSDYQVGRIYDGAAAAVGFATETGGSWTSGLLPGMTTAQASGNPFSRVSDPSVGYDAKHGIWLASVLAFDAATSSPSAVTLDRSTDGGQSWSGPVTVTSGGTSLDKDWIVCDNHSASPYYGTCYSTWDDNAVGDLLLTSKSTDGGLTWSTPSSPPATGLSPPGVLPLGLGGQPLVQPNGRLIVPALNAQSNAIIAYTSNDGGATYTEARTVASVHTHATGPNDITNGALRTEPLPSAELDAAGTVYLVWQDCNFRPGCPSNDIVLSNSTDGTTWSAPARIPIDGITSTVDHFIPGIAVDPSTSGSGARLALTYYSYPVASCTTATCALDVGVIQSNDAGATWGASQQVAGPMSVTWLPGTSQGLMVGDYISTSFLASGDVMAVIAVAQAPSGGVFDERINAVDLPSSPTLAHVSHLTVRHTGGSTTVRWFSPSRTLGFDVYAGVRQLNRRIVTSRDGWYRFHIAHVVRHVRVEAVWGSAVSTR